MLTWRYTFYNKDTGKPWTVTIPVTEIPADKLEDFCTAFPEHAETFRRIVREKVEEN